jgi:hypothetical protein
VLRVRCDNHAGEGTWLVVVDHPYVTRAAADGSYAIEGVPAGEVRLHAVAVSGLSAREAITRTVLRAAEAREVDIEFDAAQEI